MRQLVLALCFCSAAVSASASAFTGVYFFGDSLTDTGNVQTLYGLLPTKPAGAPAVVPGAPYDAQGRSSNGPIYADVLAGGLGYTATASLRGGGDYAYGGARTRYENPFGPPFLGINDQVDAFKTAHPVADPNALYVVWGGSNNLQDIIQGKQTDLLGNPIPSVSGTLADMGNILQSLYAAGARDLLVPNVANLGLTPRVREFGAVAAGQAAGLAAAYNTGLSNLLDGFAATHADAHVFRFDTFSFLNGVVANGAAFGFTNTTDRCYTGDDVTFTGGGAVCADPSSFVFWDGIHPTAAAHALLGAAMLAAVPEPSTCASMALGLLVVTGLARRRKRA